MFGREERQMTRGEQVGVRDTEIQVGKPGEERRERWAKEREEDIHTHTHTHTESYPGSHAHVQRTHSHSETQAPHSQAHRGEVSKGAGRHWD